jgi:hypothetical protein
MMNLGPGADYDAVLTGLGDETQRVWIAPVGTSPPEQVFDEDEMRAAGWRDAGILHGVLYVADQAELDRAIALADAVAEVGLEP